MEQIEVFPQPLLFGETRIVEKAVENTRYSSEGHQALVYPDSSSVTATCRLGSAGSIC